MSVDGVLTVVGVALAAIFAWAALAKLTDRAGTIETMRNFRLPLPGVWALVVPGIELAIAAALVVSPSIGALAGVTLLVFFTTFLLLQLRLGVQTPCRCFGSASASPLSIRDVVRNLALIAATMPVVTLIASIRPQPLDVVVVLVMGAALGLVWRFSKERFPA